MEAGRKLALGLSAFATLFVAAVAAWTRNPGLIMLVPLAAFGTFTLWRGAGRR